ncbi:hypothetical protein APHAL10511_008654 [Amanita phalloides]|nr:hypothetical protein APHAL10511_008654 [Amanita phalloides]
MDSSPNESARLLDAPEASLESRKKSIPFHQLLVVLLIEFSAHLPGFSIAPFINQLVSELDIIGGDLSKTGYYVGLMFSLSSVSMILASLQLNRLSDVIGRKPIILLGLVASVVSMLCFGLSRSFWGLTASFCLYTLLNCNSVINKSVVGEITNSTNRAKIFSLTLVTFSLCGIFGSLLGGNLAKPSDRFPNYFTAHIWKKYPYFLSCLVVAILNIIVFVIILCFFQETLVKNDHTPLRDSENDSPFDSSRPPRLLDVLTRPVIIAIANFASLQFFFSCEVALIPLFLSLPVEFGGLGFDPPTIGMFLAIYRITMVVILTFSPKLINRYGARLVFRLAITACLLIWLLMAMLSMQARRSGVSTALSVGAALLAVPQAVMETGIACCYMFLNASAPNKRCLGSVNGFAQIASGVVTAMGPAMAASLFSLSTRYNLLGGYAVYIVMAALYPPAILLTLGLPQNVRPVWEHQQR